MPPMVFHWGHLFRLFITAILCGKQVIMENKKEILGHRLKESYESKKPYIIILAVMIVLQILLASYNFYFKKEGFHSDELWSYGFANSFYDPYLYQTAGTRMEIQSKCEQWVDGDSFKDYIVVNDGEGFRPDSVWYNQKNDMHPPLYSTILHIICSFFPNTFSKTYAYLINIFSMIVGQIFLFKAASRMCKSDFYGLLVCAFWGFSAGFINVNTYLRMYSPLTMLGIMLLYYHCRIYYSEGSLKNNLIKVGVIVFVGALHHHYFLVLSYGIAACFCFYYFFQIKTMWKKLFAYALTMAGAAGLSIAAFPQTINHMLLFGPGDARLNNKMPFLHSLRTCFSLVMNSITGFGISPYASSNYAYVIAAIVILLAVFIPLCFLFRKEQWFINAKTKTVNALKYFFVHFDFMLLFTVIPVIFQMCIVAFNVNINIMLGTTDRYLFVIMPWTVLIIVRFLEYIIEAIKPIMKYSKQIISVVCCVAIVFSNILCPHRYFFPRFIAGEGGLETTNSPDSKYILMIESYWVITAYPDKLMECDSAFVTTADTYDQHIDDLKKLEINDSTYVVLDISTITSTDALTKDDGVENGEVVMNNTTFEFDSEDDLEGLKRKSEDEIIEDFETNIYPGYKLQFYSSESVFGRWIHTFRLVPEDEYIDIPIIDMRTESSKDDAARKSLT